MRPPEVAPSRPADAASVSSSTGYDATATTQGGSYRSWGSSSGHSSGLNARGLQSSSDGCVPAVCAAAAACPSLPCRHRCTRSLGSFTLLIKASVLLLIALPFVSTPCHPLHSPLYTCDLDDVRALVLDGPSCRPSQLMAKALALLRAAIDG